MRTFFRRCQYLYGFSRNINYYWFRRHFKNIFSFPLKKPLPILVVALGVTYKCQSTCTYCATQFYPKDKTELSFDELKQVIEEIVRLPYLFVYISFAGGEPLLNENITELIRFTREQGLFPVLNTNGLGLNETLITQFQRVGLKDIFVSLDSTDNQENDRVKGVANSYEKVIETIRLCIKKGLSCNISTYASKKNIQSGEIRKIIRLAKEIGVNSVRILPPALVSLWKEGAFSPDALSLEDEKMLKQILVPNFAYITSLKCDRANASIPICAYLQKQFIYISPYGDVQPCPFLPIVFGDVTQESLSPILERMWKEFSTLYGKEYVPCITNDPRAITHFKDKNMLAL